jgi:hypothetical protein
LTQILLVKQLSPLWVAFGKVAEKPMQILKIQLEGQAKKQGNDLFHSVFDLHKPTQMPGKTTSTNG